MAEKRKDDKGRILKTGEAQRQNGTYTYRYKGLDGTRQQVYAKSLAELREKEKQIQKDLFDGINSINGNRTVKEQFELTMKLKTNLSINSQESYRRFKSNHLDNSRFGMKKVKDIKKSDILEFYANLEESGLSRSSIKQFNSHLYVCFQFALEDGIIRFNPCKGLLKSTYDINNHANIVLLDIEEQRNFLEFVKSDSWYRWYYPLFVFMLETGCRKGETLGLTWDNVDLEERLITINHQLLYNQINGSYKFYISRPKSISGNRVIPITDFLYNVLKEHKELSFNIKQPKLDNYTNFVFLAKKGNLLHPVVINRVLDKIIERYNKKNSDKLPSITVHSLRHAACTRMSEQGMDPKVLQYVIGHSDISTTMKFYNHVSIERLKKEVEHISCVKL